MPDRRALSLALLLSACSGAGEAETTPVPLPPRRCPHGDLELEDGSCQPPGVPPERCGVGFEPDGAYGCNPVLPTQPCGDGLMAIPGETSCREVATCGRGKWGDIVVDGTTQHVDGSYAGPDSDGSAARPWPTVTQAIEAAPSGAVVAIAAGTYVEDLRTLGRPVRLWGRCPSMVTLAGAGSASQTVLVRNGADDTEIRDLAITGADIGVAVSGARVLLDRVRIHDTFHVGVEAFDVLGATRVELRRSLIERAAEVGVHGGGASVVIDQSIVRDVLGADLADPAGYGLSGEASPATDMPTSFEVRRTIVERARRIVINLIGSNALMEATLVRDGRPSADGNWGRGMSVEPTEDGFAPSSLTMRSSVVERNSDAGIALFSSEGTIEDTVVRDNLVRPSDGRSGQGITMSVAYPVGGVPRGPPGNLVVRRSLVAANHDVGILAFGAEVTLESLRVRDTQSDSRGLCAGIFVQHVPEVGASGFLLARDTLVERVCAVAFNFFGSDGVLDNVAASDTSERVDGLFGDGIEVAYGAHVDITRSLVANSARAGIANFGATLRMSTTSLVCNQLTLAGQDLLGVAASFEDAGGNLCGCGEVSEPCKVLNADLEPPEPPLPPSGM